MKIKMPRKRRAFSYTYENKDLRCLFYCGTTSLKPLPCMFTISTLLSSFRYFLSLAMYTSMLLPLK